MQLSNIEMDMDDRLYSNFIQSQKKVHSTHITYYRRHFLGWEF